MFRVALGILLTIVLLGCASDNDDIHTTVGPDYDDGGFFVQTDVPDHPKTDDVFFFKNCSPMSAQAPGSDISYRCTDVPIGN